MTLLSRLQSAAGSTGRHISQCVTARHPGLPENGTVFTLLRLHAAANPLHHGDGHTTPDERAAHAARHLNIPLMRRALRDGADINHVSSSFTAQPLTADIIHRSTGPRRQAMVEFLMRQRDMSGRPVDLTAADRAGDNVLHAAAQYGDVHLLLAIALPALGAQNGQTPDRLLAALNARNVLQQTPLMATAGGPNALMQEFALSQLRLLHAQYHGGLHPADDLRVALDMPDHLGQNPEQAATAAGDFAIAALYAQYRQVLGQQTGVMVALAPMPVPPAAGQALRAFYRQKG